MIEKSGNRNTKMKFKVPFSFASLDKLKKRSAFFKRFVKPKSKSSIGQYLEDSDIPASREDYLSICLGGFLNSFFILLIVTSTFLVLLRFQKALIISLAFSLVFSLFVFFSRSVYPKVYHSKKQKDIERNLISALQDMLVQLNSGIPLFTILVNISTSDYGELSEQFKKAVKEINAGRPQVEVLDKLGKKNPSEFFRRALWQLSNGMRAGSDISVIIEDTVNSLNQEQLIQIQDYGNKLNPAIMFYMLSSVILPALAITFLTIISSLVNLPTLLTQGLFIGLFVLVMAIQFVFLGVIKSIRPSLL